MTSCRIAIGPLPSAPLDAARAFFADELDAIRRRADAAPNDIVLVFGEADHPHEGWRRAAVQELARERAPQRVNAIASADEDAIAEASAYLSDAPGVTGQYIPLQDEAGR